MRINYRASYPVGLYANSASRTGSFICITGQKLKLVDFYYKYMIWYIVLIILVCNFIQIFWGGEEPSLASFLVISGVECLIVVPLWYFVGQYAFEYLIHAIHFVFVFFEYILHFMLEWVIGVWNVITTGKV